MPDFEFIDPGRLVDGELELVLIETVPGDPSRAWVPGYEFEMRVDGRNAGRINLRIGGIAKIINNCGNIGYGVEPEFRGHHYAERACRLILPLAKAQGQDAVYITCNPDNAASRRTIERLGAEYLNTVTVPMNSEMYEMGDRQVRRYRLEI